MSYRVMSCGVRKFRVKDTEFRVRDTEFRETLADVKKIGTTNEHELTQKMNHREHRGHKVFLNLRDLCALCGLKYFIL